MAPGTVGMHSSTSNMRRSRLKPKTYSRCCHLPSSPRRLPTLVLPLTAPTAGCASGWMSRNRASGSKTVSASTITTISWDALARPVLSAAALPELGCRITRTRGSSIHVARSAVRSVEPSSITMTSRYGCVEASSEWTVDSMPASSL